MRWHGAWLRAQITGVVFSSLVWILVAAWSFPGLLGILASAVAWVVCRNSRAGLWWRFGARPATLFEQRRVQAAIVPVASLRGRHQPAIWIGTRLGGDSVMPTERDLVISGWLLHQIVTGAIRDDQVSVPVSQALGLRPVTGSALVAAVDAYCAPWALVSIITSAFSTGANRVPLVPLAWKGRWLVFGVALVDNAQAGRWAALVGVAIIAVLSGTTPYFRKRWWRVQRDLGDARVVAEGFGPTLAAMIRHGHHDIADEERADALVRVQQPTATQVSRTPGGRR